MEIWTSLEVSEEISLPEGVGYDMNVRITSTDWLYTLRYTSRRHLGRRVVLMVNGRNDATMKPESVTNGT